MHLRLKDKTLSDPILRDLGFLLNHANVFVKQTKYDFEKRTLFLNLTRLPVIKKTALSKTKHSKEAINCEVVIRNVDECKIENLVREIETVTVLFGLHFTKDRVYLCSAQEDSGKPCYSIDCRVSGFDIEITDK